MRIKSVLTHTVQGFAGATPYVKWGNYTVLALLAVMPSTAAIAPACVRP